jgi:uncharacterized protein YneR
VGTEWYLKEISLSKYNRIFILAKMGGGGTAQVALSIDALQQIY